MKITKVVGIDIGDYRIKVSYLVKGHIKEFFYENVPDNAVKGGMIKFWDATAQFIRETLKSHGIRCKNVVFSIPVSGVYIRKVELPLMTIKQLEINLPFEFHDYISDNTDKYYYDYAVMERNEKTMQLLAVACSKELINKYRNLAKEAKLVPVGLVPDVIGIQRLLEKYNRFYSVPEGKDYAVLDMGDQSFKLHFFKDGIYDVTRNLEPGGLSFAKTVAEINGTDIHIARISLEDNVDDIQDHPKLLQMYESRAVEIMRALNFYSYSNTANTIDTLYFYGGSGNVVSFIRVLAETLNIPVKSLGNLAITKDGKVRQHYNYSPQSFGVTVDPEGDTQIYKEEELEEIKAQLEEYERAEEERYGKHEGSGQIETVAPAQPETAPAERFQNDSGMGVSAGDESTHGDTELIGLKSFLDDKDDAGNTGMDEQGEEELFRFEDKDEPGDTEDYETLKSIEELAAKIENGHKGQ